MSCGVGCRCGSDPVLLWLWHGWATAAPVGSLAWEPPSASGAAQEKAKRQKKKEAVNFSKGVVPYYIAISSAGKLQLLHILANVWQGQSFSF